MSKRSFRGALIVVLVTLALLGSAGGYVVHIIMQYPARAHVGSGKIVTVKVAKGMKFNEVADVLEQAGLIDRPSWFRIYALQKGLANKVKAGTYQLADNLSPHDLLELLVKGVEEENVSVTIPEGKSFREVFAIVAAAGIADAGELEKLARDPTFLTQQGIEGTTIEGYLFPETYRFRKPSSPRVVLETMVKQHRIVYDEVRRAHQKTLDKIEQQLKWGDREIVIMASLVEKETADPNERPRVASVFYNRLTLASFASHRLETDPTIRYGCTIPEPKSAACAEWDPAGRLHRAQLDDAANLYNTYQHAGLTPGPISNPGRAALAAAMAPETSSYLYFVAKDEHSHVFSKTLEEHQRNVDKYQK